MKKLSSILVIVTVLMLSALVLWSADKDLSMGKGMMMDKDMGEAMMGMCPVHGMMAMRMMTSRTIVATSDGGVIVYVANKLLKYDKDLNLVKKAAVDIDYQEMLNMVNDMKKNCSVCQMGETKVKERMDKKQAD